MSGVAPTGETALGVDLASFAGVVDWSKLASSVAFAIIRVGDGLGTDARFAQNWAGAKAAGVMRGAYQFFRASRDPIAQADLLSNAVGSLGLMDLPPACDLELNDGVSLAAIPALVQKWADRVKSNLGVTPLLYTMPGFYDSLPPSPLDGSLPLWVANWQVAAPKLPRGWTSWDFWQYKANQAIEGAGSVDLNVFNGSALALKWYAAKKVSAPVVGGFSGGESGPPGLGSESSAPTSQKVRGCGDGDGG